MRGRWVVVALAACGGGGGAAGVAGNDAAIEAEIADPTDPDPSFTDEDRALLATLSPATLPAPPRDVTNAYADDANAARLGQAFFFTTLLSGPLLDGDENGGAGTLGMKGDVGRVACASCHVPTTDFADTRSPSEQISLASSWGIRRAPSLLDVGQAKLVMWDGRHDALYDQVFGPIESPLEMNASRLFVAEQVFAHFKADYERVFGAMPPLDDATRFPPLAATNAGCTPNGSTIVAPCNGTFHGAPGDHAEFDSMAAADQLAVTRVVVNVGKAIGAYERLLGCGPSRFDAWMHGEVTALSRAEQRGAEVFVGPGKCVACHAGPYFSDQSFHDVGLAPATVAAAFLDANDHGAALGLAAAIVDPLNTHGPFSDGDDHRLPATVDASLEGAFRTPTLRCVARRPSFFHTGQSRSLDAVVAHFDHGGDAAGFEGTNELRPLGLSALQRADLVAFLRALDGPGAADSLTHEP